MCKIFRIFVFFMLVLGLSVSNVSAKETSVNFLDKMNNEEKTKSFKSNEYESLLSSVAKYEKNLSHMNNSIYRIEDHNNYLKNKKMIEDYPNFIYSKKNLSVSELKEQNYTDSQIQAIKNYDGSQQMTILASATVRGTLRLVKYSYDSTQDKTFVNTNFEAVWNGVPFVKLIDEMGIAVNGSTARFAKVSSSNYVMHYSSTVYNTTSKYHSMAGVSYKFGIVDSQSRLFKKAYMTYNSVAQGRVTVMDYGAVYVHATQSVQVGLSIGYGGSGGVGVGFSLESGTTNMWENTYTRTTFLQ